MNRFSGRLALLQRVLPNYRVPLFDLLAASCDKGMTLFSGLPRPEEGITTAGKLQITNYRLGKNFHLFRGPFYLCFQPGLINWLQENNPDALVVEANPRCISTASAIEWMHARKRKVVGWGLGAPSLPGLLAGFRARGWRSFLSRFEALIAYSQRGADEYAALGFPREKIFVAYNSVSNAPAQIPGRSPLTLDRAAILFVGRLQARKRVDALLRACAELESKPRLMIVGDGPQRAGLESLAKQIYPLAEFVGAKHGAELKPYFTEADLFILPGTGGLAVQEAMSYSLPVIVAKGDGTQDDLVRAANGWQIPPNDFEALVSALKNALSDVSRLRKMGAESYRIVSEEINIQKMVDVFIQALNK